MPSQLGREARRYFQTNAFNSSASRFSQFSTNRAHSAQAPWGGHAPGLDPSMAQPSDAMRTVGLVPANGRLELDDGFVRVDNSNLPLGDAGAEPVVGLFGYRDNLTNSRRLAVTGDASWGRVYQLEAGLWEEVTWAGDGGGQIKGDSANPDAGLVSFTFFPAGNFLVFCNYHDDVMRWTQGSTYSVFEDTYFDNFGAKTVETFGSRLVFANTRENSVAYPSRVRWTNVSASPTLDEGTVGTGFTTLDDLEGEGLRLLKLGNVLACYFDKGVALLQPTILPTAAFARQFVSHDRGLLSTHSAVNLGSGVHFGIFNDGWFFFESTGRWTERGIRNVGGRRYHAFKDEFYNSLNFNSRSRVTCALDRNRRFIRIAFPTAVGDTEDATAPDTVWIYDVDTDTVWPDEYNTNQPNCWGEYEDLTADQSWDSFSGDLWKDNDDIRWGEYGSRAGKFRQTHGTTDGLVFRHAGDATERLKDGQTSSWLWQGHRQDMDSPILWKMGDKLYVRYVRQDTGQPFTAQVITEQGGSAGTSMAQLKGFEGTEQIDYVNVRTSGKRLGVQISGMGKVSLRGFDLQYILHGDGQLRSTS